jgi:hypothetical protein
MDWIIMIAGSSGASSSLERIVMDPSTLVGREGYYRVGKSTRGRWWIVRPDGRPMLYKGLCSMGPLPPPNRPAPAEGSDEPIPSDELAAYWLGQLAQTGFNGLGSWVKEHYWNRGWPFTVLIHVRKATDNLWTVHPPKHVDIFDAAWRAAYDAKCRQICTPLANSKDLLGYFVDNEPSWGQVRQDHVWGQNTDAADRNVQGVEPLLLQYFLALEPHRGGHKAAWDFVLARHGGSVAKLASDWNANFDSPGKFLELHRNGMVLSSANFGRDHDDFTVHFTREYFRVTAETIRRYDPNHLLLGCRFGGPPGGKVLEAHDRRHVDVLTANNYRTNFHERMDEYHRPTGLPILNGEFNWYSGHWADWDKIVNHQPLSAEEVEFISRMGPVALEKAFTHPALIGYTWFKFCTPSCGAHLPACGMFDPSGHPNRFNHDLLRQIHPRLEAIASGELEPARG